MHKLIGVIGIVFLLVIPHEFAHFLAARASGVGVYRASVGFGPQIACAEVGGTALCLSWIPLGGYVALADELALERFSEEQLSRMRSQSPEVWQSLTSQEGWLSKQAPLVRFFIALAGAAGNFLYVLLILPFLFRAAREKRLTLNSYFLLEREAHGKELIGPIGLFRMAGAAGEKGKEAFLLLSVRFAIGLGVLQLLPLPFLDGMHLLHAAFSASFMGRVVELLLMIVLSLLLWSLYRRCVYQMMRLRILLEVQRRSPLELVRSLFRRVF